ncbi:MAG: tetraacyldisaccharide 4'-kinase [Acidobacteria bacterium]|nr:tetraacyldisaccharide 4'-kinase [Acidobacteriota bacterium]
MIECGTAARWALGAPAILYAAAVRARNALYDVGWLSAQRLPCPAISIGNLTVGGTGKTPLCSHLAGFLSDAGYRTAVLSRGYRREGGPAPRLVSDGHRLLAEVAVSGDEPYLIARDNPSVAVAVGANRVEAARCLTNVLTPEVILLDDAFQHRRIMRDVDLLLVDGSDPFGNGRMLPLGPLREPIEAVRRADALVITRSAGRVPAALASILERHHSHPTVFHVRIEPRGFLRSDGEALAPVALKGLSAYAFSGIARPERFEAQLDDLGLRVAGTRRFRDHHRYRSRDLEEIARSARELRADVLVTTDKDFVRIDHWPSGAPTPYALALQVIFPHGSDLPSWLLDRLNDLRVGRDTGRPA